MSIDIDVAQDLVRDESMLLDQRRFDEWLKLFTTNATYRIPIDPNNSSANSLHHVFDDYARMCDRVKRTSLAVAEDPPSRTARVLGPSRTTETNDTEVVLWTPFHILVHRQGQTQAFGGSIEHRIVAVDSDYRIQQKSVALISSESPLPAMPVVL